MSLLNFHLRVLACAVTLIVAASVARGQEAPSLLPSDNEIRQATAVAASVIPPEHAASDIRRIAGEYSYGNGFDMNCTLEISPDGRFLYKRCNCETVVDQARGMVKLEDGRLVLTPENPRASWPRGTSQVLMPVSWGQRLYLVPQNDLLGFSNQINRGVEPVSRGSLGNYYLREGDWDRPVTGKPNLPEEWQALLLEEPVVGRVAGHDPSKRWIIDLGQEDGVFNGMVLSAWATNSQRFVKLVVTETGSHTSAVQIVGAPRNLSIQGWVVYSRVAPPAAVPRRGVPAQPTPVRRGGPVAPMMITPTPMSIPAPTPGPTPTQTPMHTPMHTPMRMQAPAPTPTQTSKQMQMRSSTQAVQNPVSSEQR